MKASCLTGGLIVLALMSACSRSADSTVAAAPSADDPRFVLPATDEGLPGVGPFRREDWFQNVWRERRSAWTQTVAQDQGALVFFGDSITQGWNGLADAFPGLKVANRGIGGDLTRGLLVRLQDDVLALNPRGVVLLIGTNDLDVGATPEIVAANVRQLVATILRHNPQTAIVLCEVFPSSAKMNRPAEKIRRVNELYAAIAREQPHVTLVETWRVFANAQGDAKPEEFPDLLHPNEAGYARWAAALRPVLAQLGFVTIAPGG